MYRRIRQNVVLACAVLLLSLFAFSGQAFAQTTTNSDVNGNQISSFRCVARPKIQAPPEPFHQKMATQVLQPICASGQVPQSINTRITEKGRAPLPVVPHKANIAAGYHYVYGYQYATALGGDAYFSQHTPFLSSSDNHTLAETASESSDGRQIVEIGWTVDRGLNGDSNPHLFVFSWVNGNPNCYNGCGYVQYSNTFRPGQAVAGDGSVYLYAIEYYQGNWWLYSQNQWLGYFPGTLWSNQGVNFSQVGLVQWFGEVSSGGGSGTQMGNGIYGSNSGSATITNASFITSVTTATAANLSVNATDPSCYNSGVINTSAFGFGGPGC